MTMGAAEFTSSLEAGEQKHAHLTERVQGGENQNQDQVSKKKLSNKAKAIGFKHQRRKIEGFEGAAARRGAKPPEGAPSPPPVYPAACPSARAKRFRSGHVAARFQQTVGLKFHPRNHRTTLAGRTPPLGGSPSCTTTTKIITTTSESFL